MATRKNPRSTHQVLASTSRAAVLQVLRDRGGAVGVEDVAAAVGLHPNTVREHLDVLVGAGFAVRSTLPSTGPGRPRTGYRATAAPEDGTNYRLLAEVLTRYLAATSPAPGRDAAAAGRAWVGQDEADDDQPGASEAEAVAAVVELLAANGFQPELAADGTHIDLRHCPFRDLAESNPDVVCGAHLGILQGALAHLGAPVAATRLLPLVEPDRCVAQLERRPAV